jgi:hypothetical protein
MVTELNYSLTSAGQTPAMPILAQDGLELAWEINRSARGGFDAEYCVHRRVSSVTYTETDMRHFHSRETAVGWLRAEVAIRGFDGRGIR